MPSTLELLASAGDTGTAINTFPSSVNQATPEKPAVSPQYPTFWSDADRQLLALLPMWMQTEMVVALVSGNYDPSAVASSLSGNAAAVGSPLDEIASISGQGELPSSTGGVPPSGRVDGTGGTYDPRDPIPALKELTPGNDGGGGGGGGGNKNSSEVLEALLGQRKAEDEFQKHYWKIGDRKDERALQQNFEGRGLLDSSAYRRNVLELDEAQRNRETYYQRARNKEWDAIVKQQEAADARAGGGGGIPDSYYLDLLRALGAVISGAQGAPGPNINDDVGRPI